MTIGDLEKQTVRNRGFTNFKIQSLFNIDAFSIKIALVVPGFIDNEKVFPRAVNKVKLCKLDPLLNWCTAEDYLLDVYFAFFLKSISETNVIDKRWQISAESCQLISQTKCENKQITFRKFCSRCEKTVKRRYPAKCGDENKGRWFETLLKLV